MSEARELCSSARGILELEVELMELEGVLEEELEESREFMYCFESSSAIRSKNFTSLFTNATQCSLGPPTEEEEEEEEEEVA